MVQAKLGLAGKQWHCLLAWSCRRCHSSALVFPEEGRPQVLRAALMAEAPLVAVMPPGGDWPAELELTKDLRLISGCKSAVAVRPLPPLVKVNCCPPPQPPQPPPPPQPQQQQCRC